MEEVSHLFLILHVVINISYTVAPVITAIPATLSAVNVIIGSSLTLTCISFGSPPDTFFWIKDGVPIAQSANITTIHYNSTDASFSTSYTINNANISDNGTYSCNVTNPIGSNSHTFTINICKLLNYC